MLPDSGRKLSGSLPPMSGRILAEIVGDALRSELGASRRATKTVMGWTGVCDRAARLWINGNGGMSGAHLVQLARRSDAVWRALMQQSHREEAMLGFDIHAVEVALARAMGSIEMLKRQAIATRGRR